MALTGSDPGGLQALAAVDVARRQNIGLRIVLCLIVATLFHPLTGMVEAGAWAVVYCFIQISEQLAFRAVDAADKMPASRRVALLLFLVASNSGFAAFGFLEARGDGIWGILCAGLLWSGAVLNGVMVSGDSRSAFLASILPPLLGFMVSPYFVVGAGGSVGIALAVVAGGALNAASAAGVWAATRRQLVTATREREMARLAMVDLDTGLRNRYALECLINERRAAGDPVAVVAVALDRFDDLYHAIGHAAMIALLRQMAARLSAHESGAQVARISLGTFAFLMSRDGDEEQMQVLQLALEQPILVDGHPIDIGVTIGLAASDPSVVPVIDRAMIAVKQARQRHKRLARFDAEFYASISGNLSLMSDMQRALRSGEMDLHYQPKYDLRSGTITGVEALLRWNHPQRGCLPPDSFLPLAEETGRIAALTEWVLLRAVEDQKRLHARGYAVSVAVNLSARLITDNEFALKILAIAGRAVGKIILEVTETAVIANLDDAGRVLDVFRRAGITVAIDDYGTGLASLGYLRHIPCDELKIDKTFILNLASDRTDELLVRSAVNLGRSLGLEVVAEGVETEGALQRLADMGCDLAQGYFIARPMPLPDLETFLAHHQSEGLSGARGTAA
jgi:predicted signal transduction protein with EAL and GGDEF domain